MRSKNFKFWAGKFKGSFAVYKQMARANTYPSLNIIKNSESDWHAREFSILLGSAIISIKKVGADCENLAVFTAAQRQFFFREIELNFTIFLPPLPTTYILNGGKKTCKIQFHEIFFAYLAG